MPKSKSKSVKRTNSIEKESKTNKTDSKANENDSKTKDSDSKTSQNDSKIIKNDSKTSQNDTKINEKDSKTKDSDSNTSQNDSKAIENDTKTNGNDSKISENDSITSQNDRKTIENDTKTKDNDTKTIDTDSKTNGNNSKPSGHDSNSNIEYESTLSIEDLKYLDEKFGENDIIRESKIKEIREWLKTKPYIRADESSKNLLKFLRHTKYNLGKSKIKIENFYKLKTNVPEWFRNRDLNQKKLQELLELGTFLPLLKKDKSNRTIILVRPTVYNPSVYSQNDLMKLNNMVFDRCLELDESINIYGVNVILDLKDVKMGHILKPKNVKKAVHSWQNCYPVSPKRFDFIFAPRYVNYAVDVFRFFMNDKMKKRIHVHYRGLGSLKDAISPEILPEEYGGSSGTIQELIEHWKNEMMNAKDWFIDEEKYGIVKEKDEEPEKSETE